MQSGSLLKQNLHGEQGLNKASSQGNRQRRPYVYELDQLRVITALSVIAVHVLSFTAFLNAGPLGTLAQNGVLDAFHFTRNVFMFITGLALVYTYYGKPFSLPGFWKKRAVGVVLPYIIWSVIYTGIHDHQRTSPTFLTKILWNILTGDASYQLYYILLTIQFYLLFPVFLWLLKCVARYPWTVLSVSFGVQVIGWTVDYFTLELHVPYTGFWGFVARYQDSFLFTYQFYFVLGGMVALRLATVRAWLLAHRAWVFASLGVTLTALLVVYYYQLQVARASLNYAIQVLQPAMVFYSVSMIFFLYWLTYRRVSKRVSGEQLKGQRVWRTLSDATFGVYLIHPVFLSSLLLFVIPFVKTFIPGGILVVLTWLVTVSCAVVSAVFLMYTPILSRLVGRSRRLSDGFPPAEWLKRVVLGAGLASAGLGRYAFLPAAGAASKDSPALPGADNSSLPPAAPSV